MADPQAPLILCMENASGEEVTLRIEQDDDFQSFLTKSKSLLGFDVDINSITRNQPVSLSDNIYQFLVTAEQDSQDLTLQSYDPLLEPSNDANDLVYILDDGTQIRASQIHFDNDDPQVDLTAEKIPFVKYTDDIDDFDVDNVLEEDTKKFNIVESPVSRWSSKNSSPKCSFVNSLPFKLVCNNTSVFEAQFTKYLETSTAKTYTTLNPVTNRNKSPRSLIRENYKSYDDKINRGDDFTGYTREEVLNMFKDSPVASIPCESQNFNEKRKHVRKSDPTRAVHKSWNSKPANYDENILIGDNENQNCFICGKFVENNIEKLYLFDNEDQKLHRSSPQKKSSRQLKIICENCLGENFKPMRMKGPNQCLNSDEYLVIRNNQQYIFQKTNKIDFKCNTFINDTACINVSKETSVKHRPEKEKVEFVKVEIGSDGEIVTKPIDNDPRSSDDIIIVKDEGKESSSDVEIVETPEIDENIIDHLEDADEEVKEFLGKYQCANTTTAELKCRFCERVFVELSEVMEHVDQHKHDHDEGVVYPCPICDYGYAKSGWLKAHLKTAHEKTVHDNIKKEQLENNNNDPDEKSALASPIARRTRSSTRRTDDNPEKDSIPVDDQKVEAKEEKGALADIIIKTEIKQEAVDSSDDEIWIVQTGDETSEQLESLLHAAKAAKEGQSEGRAKKMHKCFTCSRIFATEDSLNTHKCRRRAKKRKSPSKEDNAICVPTKEDFIKRAQGRTRPVMEQSDTSNDLLVPRTRRKKTKGPTSDPQIVTCHNCNESFTSKVRLKFHMQFHSPTNMLTADGRYKCVECVASRPTEACFPAEAALFDHIHFRHHKRRRWQCPVRGCGKTFHLRATLTKHSRTHTDTRRYVCVTCNKRFLDKQTLDEHGVTHLQIKPFQCHICLKQLTRRSRLRMHLRAHEEELTPKLVLVCGVCSRAFRDHEDAQAHAAKSSECLEEFTKELKEETEEVTAQLSPTSGLVRQTMKITESPKLSKPVPRQVAAPLARPLLASLGAAARSIIRVVEVEKAFRCEYCEDVFYLEDGLNAHRAIHKNVNNPFTCHICKVSFATYSRCTTHKTTHGFYKRPLADAKRQAWGPNAGPSATGILGYGGFPVAKHFLCEDCGRSYLHWTYLQVHRRMKHANDNFLYKCNQCDLTFPNSWSLAYHRKKIHGQTGQGEAGATSKVPREDYRIPCRDCDEVLPNKTALYKHRKKEHSDLTLRVNNKPGTSCCGSCGKQHSAECGGSSENQNDDVQKSMDVTVPRRAHSCPVCACSFRSASVRDEHLRTHTGERPFPCDLCPLAFRSASVRDEHLRTHTGERPFPCDLCPLAFRRSTAMRNHRLIHTGVRAWACPRCPKRFRIRSELRTHARLKHPKHLAVIEILGLNPSPDEVMEHLAANNIAHDKVIEITKMSFPKGASSVVPSCARALAMLGNIPRTAVAYSKPLAGDNDFQPARRGRGIAKNPRRPKILQRGEDTDQDVYPVALNVSNELTDADVQMMLRDGVLVDGSQMVRLQLNDSLLLE